MRIGTKILLLTVLIVVGLSGLLSWIVTMSVTRYETIRADDQITLAIGHYQRELDQDCRQITHLVQVFMGDPSLRAQLQSADEDPKAREQLKREVFGHDIQTELGFLHRKAAFHVLINYAREVVVVSVPDGRPGLEKILSSGSIRWPADAVLDPTSQPVRQYVATTGGLFLVMGVPLRVELSQPPSHAYFVGFLIDDEWARRQLLDEQPTADSTIAPLSAWFVVKGKVLASASSDMSDTRHGAFDADSSSIKTTATTRPTVNRVDFDLQGERFVGQSFEMNDQNAAGGQLILASSLDQALAPMRAVRRSILLTALAGCAIAIFACRRIAVMISRPIESLVEGTRRVAGGDFAAPVVIHRRDELGTLADSFNQMAVGLQQREKLLQERHKLERDLAVARKIQMDVLPKIIPDCPGYDMAAFSLPAEQTGGDIYDLVAVTLDPEMPNEPPSIVLLLADASGHGIGPALSVTQVRAMLRIGVRLRAGVEDIFAQINRQLCQDLGSERFVTAFLGLLDPSLHRISYQSAGQAPLLHFHAKNHRFEWLGSSMPPLGVMDSPDVEKPEKMALEPGDMVILLTDGFYEFMDAAGNLFGRQRIEDAVLLHHHKTSSELLFELLSATREFAHGAPQMDDMTGLIIRRLETTE